MKKTTCTEEERKEILNQGFDEALEKLSNIAGSSEEKKFLNQYAEETRDRDIDTRWHLCHWPALIPQVWVNIIHYAPTDKERADRAQQEPQRVDFVSFSFNKKIIIEIDGESHFTEILNLDDRGMLLYEPSMEKYSLHLKKDRWLRKQGWEVWRFSTKEVKEETIPELLRGITETGFDVPF